MGIIGAFSMNRLIKSPYIKKYKSNLYKNSLLGRLQILNHNDLAVLEACKKGMPVEELYKLFPARQIDKLCSGHLLLEENCIWSLHYIKHLEIEISTACNWKCEYCPRSFNSPQNKVMDLKLFCKILDDAKKYKHIKYITINSYNEPTISPVFLPFIDEIAKRGFMLTLYTNGSGLNEYKIKYLQDLGNLRKIIFDYPSDNRVIFNKMTGTNDYDRTKKIIDMALSNGLKVGFSVQGLNSISGEEIKQIQKAYPEVPIIMGNSNDRAGALKNQYYQDIHITCEHLSGCDMIMEAAVVTVNGDLCICCNDYYRKCLLGNIQDISLSEILSSQQYCDLRKKVWGGISAEWDFICRHCVHMHNSIAENIIDE